MISPLLMLLLPLTDLRTAAFQRATLRSIRLYPISSGGNPASRKILVGDSPARYRMTHTCLKALEYVMRSFDTLATAGRSRNIWSSSMLNDPPPRIVLPPLLYPVMKQVYIRLLTSSFSNIADRISLQPVGHTSMRAIMEYPQPPALTFIARESIHNSLTPNACAQYVRRRLLTATATPAPPTSSATTVNSTVPAAPVSGS